MGTAQKILVNGLGSMGNRRIGNLQMLDRGFELAAFDPSAERRKLASDRHGIRVFETFTEALDWQPDAAIISTPPTAHVELALTFARAGIHFFVEASVVDDGLAEVVALLQDTNTVGVPSCTMRFHPGIRLIHDLLHKERVLGEVHNRCAFNYHMGQYLPDWHPHEAVSSFYVGQQETSGTREMVCFENVWLSWLFGLPTEVSAQSAKLTGLDVDIEDVYQLLLRYESGAIGNLQIDVISRVPYRSLRIVSEDGVVEWSARENRLRCFHATNGEWTDYQKIANEDYRGGNFSGENMYVAEMAAFFAAVDGDLTSYPYSFTHDRHILALLAEANISDRDGVRRQVSPLA